MSCSYQLPSETTVTANKWLEKLSTHQPTTSIQILEVAYINRTEWGNEATLLLCLKVSPLHWLIDDDSDPDWRVGSLSLIFSPSCLSQILNNLEFHQRQPSCVMWGDRQSTSQLHSIFISALINKQQSLVNWNDYKTFYLTPTARYSYS